MFPQHFPKVIPPNSEIPSNRPKRKNLKKMPENFFMTDEVHAQVMQTITKIEEAQSTQLEID